jgi:hypothetical protein
MPTSDGVIRSSDVANDAVITRCVDGQAITVTELEDPVFAEIASTNFLNISLTTSYADAITDTITVPSWVGDLDVLLVSDAQITNGSGALQSVICRNTVGGTVLGAGVHDVTNGETGQVSKASGRSISSPGATVAVLTEAKVGASTNSNNGGRHVWTAIGTR